jgi:glycerol transport system ATP-binding protein
VQIGSASDLFERPAHTFVGHFIGSPGMNFLPAQIDGVGVTVAGRHLMSPSQNLHDQGSVTLGVRPEYVTLAHADAAGAVPATVTQAQDIGTYWLVTATTTEGGTIKARLGNEQSIPKAGDKVWLNVVSSHTCFYKNETLIA